MSILTSNFQELNIKRYVMTSKNNFDIIGVESFPESAIERLSKSFQITKFRSTDEISLRTSTHIWVDLGITVDEKLLQKYPLVTHVVCRATATTNISEQVIAKGIQILSLKEHKTFLSRIPSTAELAWFLLQISNVPIFDLQDQIAAGTWDRSRLLRNQLQGKKVGIIGMGRLGNIVAKYSEAFEMNISYAELDTYKSASKYFRTSISNLCEHSDFIVITASLSERLEPLLDVDMLRKCNPNLRIINVSRGSLIDESFLIQQLTDKKIAFYATDTCRFEEFGATKEDWVNFKKFTSMRNVFLTPHIGGYSVEAIDETTHHLIDYLYERICECIVSVK
jgi:phosphoglycerate dehydrogenase-like enzyme